LLHAIDIDRPVQLRSLGARLKGHFGQGVANALVIADFDHNVVSFSLLEDLLWTGNVQHRAIPERMNEFFDICREVVEWRRPITIAVGSEPAMPADLRITNGCLPERYRYTDQSLSDSAAAQLLHWYNSVYLKRWQTPPETTPESTKRC
jgi:hypothetical protein